MFPRTTTGPRCGLNLAMVATSAPVSSYGFIYNRWYTGKLTAANTPPAPAPELNPAPRDLRSPAERDNEVAELPDRSAPARAHHTVLQIGHASCESGRIELRGPA